MSVPVTASQRARSAIFARLHEARREPAGAGVPEVDAALAPLVAEPDGESRRQRFIRHARSWQAEVIETTPLDWPVQLLALLRARGVRQLFAGPGSPIAATLQTTVPAAQLRWFDRELAALKPELFAADAGITTTLGGIAASGSLLLQPSIEEPRTLSLVLPLHIALLHDDALHDSLLAAMRHHGWAQAMPSNLLTITGPSKTADIQRMLVYGAHGPRELVILLVQHGDADAR